MAIDGLSILTQGKFCRWSDMLERARRLLTQGLWFKAVSSGHQVNFSHQLQPSGIRSSRLIQSVNLSANLKAPETISTQISQQLAARTHTVHQHQLSHVVSTASTSSSRLQVEGNKLDGTIRRP